MQLIDLPVEILDRIFNQDLPFRNLHPDIRYYCYSYLKCSVVLNHLYQIELERIKAFEFEFYINFGAKHLQPKRSKYLVFHYEDVLQSLNWHVSEVISYAQVWPGAEMLVGTWGLYLFSYPFCIDNWSQLYGTGSRISDTRLPKMRSNWPLVDSQKSSIESCIAKLGYSFARDDVFKASKSIFVFLYTSGLKEFLRICSSMDPEFLSIRIIPEKSNEIIDRLCFKKFSRMKTFSLEYDGPQSFIDIEAIIKLLNFDTIKNLSIHVPHTNILELLWQFSPGKRESFTLISTELTIGRVGSNTSKAIFDQLKNTFETYSVYTIGSLGRKHYRSS
ncbi:hypothetical protein I9W82_001565 [Candida metapsilosis]|uniref:Uncharacterized protein n=1 Tax=Candida metapsilosis TaxID=273372 RepID=A0A8H7ZHJ4_9ASCO|nr:hypothetical protein I9W82_001565 [Candida metapsilosis]